MRQQQETDLRCSGELVRKDEIVWEGKPFLPAYLLCNERMFGMTVVWILLFWYFHFAWSLPLLAWSGFWFLCFTAGIWHWLRMRYFVTPVDLAVQIGKRVYRLSERDVNHYCVISHPTEWVLGCRTIQYGFYLGYSSTKGNKANLWRNKTRFWCIKEWREVDAIIRQSLCPEQIA